MRAFYDDADDGCDNDDDHDEAIERGGETCELAPIHSGALGSPAAPVAPLWQAAWTGNLMRTAPPRRTPVEDQLTMLIPIDAWPTAPLTYAPAPPRCADLERLMRVGTPRRRAFVRWLLMQGYGALLE